MRSGTSPVELRIETGLSMGRSPEFRDDNTTSTDCFILTTGTPGDCGGTFDQIGSSGIIGIGVGYGLGNGKRVDIGYSRRSGFELQGSDAAGTSFDPAVTADTIMLSAAFELPVKWGPMRPYLGAGIGVSRNEMGALKWVDGNDSGTLTGGTTTSFAWSLTLGAELDVSDNVILEFGYRYIDLGEIKKDAGPDQQPGQSGTFNASGNTGSATGKLRADELLLSLRIGWFVF
ncbi:MAG: outer membrane protein [Burkholderiales bacterium]